MQAIARRDWFEDHELEHCPRCKELNAIVTPDVNAVICIDCGFVGFRASGEHGAA